MKKPTPHSHPADAMSMSRRSAAAASLLAVSLCASAAVGQSGGEGPSEGNSVQKPPAPEGNTDDSDVNPGGDGDQEPFKLTFALGAKGGVQFQGATEVPENVDYRANGMQHNYGDTNIYGEFGVGGGGGPVVEIRAQDTYGLETGFYFTADNAKGKNDISSEQGEDLGDVIQYQKTKALHIPVLLKFSPPFEDVRPVLGLGLEFVIQRESSLSYEYKGEVSENRSRAVDPGEPLPSERNGISTTDYTAFLATAGVEFDAGPVRIPLELRVAYNLGWNEEFSQRVNVKNPRTDDERFIYNGEYLGHFGIWTGIEYRWDFMLGQEGPGADGPEDG